MNELTADYVIVGAGTAGCVLSARLSEDPSCSVLLIEAGDKDRHPYIHVPAGFLRLLEHPSVTWRSRTRPHADTDGREAVGDRLIGDARELAQERDLVGGLDLAQAGEDILARHELRVRQRLLMKDRFVGARSVAASQPSTSACGRGRCPPLTGVGGLAPGQRYRCPDAPVSGETHHHLPAQRLLARPEGKAAPVLLMALCPDGAKSRKGRFQLRAVLSLEVARCLRLV